MSDIVQVRIEDRVATLTLNRPDKLNALNGEMARLALATVVELAENPEVGCIVVTGAGMAFFLGLAERRIWAKGLAFLAAVLMVHAVMFSFSRGGMLSLIITGVVAFLLISKKPAHVLMFVVALMLALRLAGPEVRTRFSSVFVDPAERDASTTSRLDSWKGCWDAMKHEPIVGVGPNHWRSVAGRYGYPGLEAHSLWLQAGAELGFPGLGFLLAFYGICVMRLYPMTRPRAQIPDPWLRDVARMVIASLAGFAVAAQFVSISGLELPYYVVMVGALAIKLSHVSPAARAAPANAPQQTTSAPPAAAGVA